MSNSDQKELTQLERAQLLRDFIRAEIQLAILESGMVATKRVHITTARELSDKLFAQIAGTGEGE